MLYNESDVREMLKDVKEHRLLEIYVVVPSKAYALPHKPYQDVLETSAHTKKVKVIPKFVTSWCLILMNMV